MKLTLRIENFDFLPDGGPLEFSVTARGCEAVSYTHLDVYKRQAHAYDEFPRHPYWSAIHATA